VSWLTAKHNVHTNGALEGMSPGKLKNFSGAIKLVSNPMAINVIITVEHTDKNGRSKILI